MRPDVEVVDPPAGIRVDWDVPVVVRDGTTLRANVFRPAAGRPVPAIVSAHPYGKDRIPARTRSGRGVNVQYRIMPQPHTVRISSWTSWEAPDPAVWVPHGYAVVNADARGGGTSEGVGELFSEQEAVDYEDLVEWVAAQPWCTGRVGLDGVSYLAISQYGVAARRPPNLAAICPWEGFSDLYRDFAYQGGVREDGFRILWGRLTRRAARLATDVSAEVARRPERDEWYDQRTPDLGRIDVPMLVCASFSDHCLHSRGSFEAFRRAGSGQRWLYTHRDGKWAHYYGEEATAARRRFFERTLGGLDDGGDARPPVRLAIYDTGAEPVAVSYEDEWPPADLTWSSLALDLSQRRLVPLGSETLPSWAGELATRGAPLTFDWVVPEDLDVIGPSALKLWVEGRDLDDANLFVALRKLRDSREVTFEGSYGFDRDVVTTGWQRLAHRELDAELSTEAQPVHTHRQAEPLRPGEIVPVDVALAPHATRFRTGDVVRLELRGHWHLRRDPIRGQAPAGYRPSRRGHLVVRTGGAFDSGLLLGHRPTR